MDAVALVASWQVEMGTPGRGPWDLGLVSLWVSSNSYWRQRSLKLIGGHVWLGALCGISWTLDCAKQCPLTTPPLCLELP